MAGAPRAATRLFLGLDLGRIRDNTALVVLEPWSRGLAIVHLQTWRPEREDMVDALVAVDGFLARHAGRAALAVDGNGAGAHVARAALGGHVASIADVFPVIPWATGLSWFQRPEDGWVRLGKVPAVEALRAAVATRRVLPAPGLEEGKAMLAELHGMVLAPTRRGTGQTWTHRNQSAGSHDDRVQAAAYALWLADTLTSKPGALRPANHWRQGAALGVR